MQISNANNVSLLIPNNISKELILYQKYIKNNNMNIDISNVNIVLKKNNKQKKFMITLLNQISEYLNKKGINDIKIDLVDFINFNNSIDFMYKNFNNYDIMRDNFFNYIFEIMNLKKIFGQNYQIIKNELNRSNFIPISNKVEVINSSGGKIKKGGFNNNTLSSLCFINYIFILMIIYCKNNINISGKLINNKKSINQNVKLENLFTSDKVKIGGIEPNLLLYLLTHNYITTNFITIEYLTGHTIKETIKKLFNKYIINKGTRLYQSLFSYIYEKEKPNKLKSKNQKNKKCPKCLCKCECDYKSKNENNFFENYKNNHEEYEEEGEQEEYGENNEQLTEEKKGKRQNKKNKTLNSKNPNSENDEYNEKRLMQEFTDSFSFFR